MSRPALIFASLLVMGCNPYQNFDTEYAYFGPVDPAKFPAAYLGTDGRFSASQAFVDGRAVGHYLFPADAKAATDLSTRLPQLAYSFANCVAPTDYIYDARRDTVRADEQGVVFTELPDTSGYVPIVRHVPVTGNQLQCQYFKDEETVVKHDGVDVSLEVMPPVLPTEKGKGIPDGKYFAWALIDPGAEVRFPDGTLSPVTGLGPQKFGYFNRFLTAYIDGGELPVDAVAIPGMQGAPPTAIVQARTQNVYYPLTVVGADGGLAAGTLGMGYDVLDGARGDAKYSPLCRVFSYRPSDPNFPARSVSDIDTSTLLPDARGYVYCLQVTQ